MSTKKFKVDKQKKIAKTLIDDYKVKINLMESFIKQLNKGCLLTLAQENVLLEEEYHRADMMFDNFMMKQLKACSSKKEIRERIKDRKLQRSGYMDTIKDLFQNFRDTAEKEGWVVQ